MGIGSVRSEFCIPDAQIPQCGFVCSLFQSQTPIVCFSISRQPCVSDRCSLHELELSSCICLSHNNPDSFCSRKDSGTSVQNSCNSSVLARTTMVPRTSQPSSVHFICPRLLTQSKGRFLHQSLPVLDLHAWELSNNQSEIENFHKTLQILSQNQEEHLLRKSTTQSGSSSLIGAIEGRLIRSQPLSQL